jgi:hypothetical protein
MRVWKANVRIVRIAPKAPRNLYPSSAIVPELNWAWRNAKKVELGLTWRVVRRVVWQNRKDLCYSAQTCPNLLTYGSPYTYSQDFRVSILSIIFRSRMFQDMLNIATGPGTDTLEWIVLREFGTYHVHFSWLIHEASGNASVVWLIVANSPTRELKAQEWLHKSTSEEL